LKQYSILIEIEDENFESSSQQCFYAWKDLKYDIVLGIPWLQSTTPVIDWSSLTLNNASNHVIVAVDLSLIPSEYLDHKHVFDKPTGKAALPPHRPFDLSIELKDPNDLPVKTNLWTNPKGTHGVQEICQ
jgi:hypothetical protein